MKKMKQNNGEIRLLYIASAIILALALGMAGWFISQKSSTVPVANSAQQDAADEAPPCPYRRALDGVCVENSAQQFPKLVAIMIENHSNARPQSGLADASVVYEAPVEGNYSRFLTLFPIDAEVEKAGPVRSARPYFLDWAQEYAAPMYMHVGGSPDALQKITADGIFDMDEFYRGWYFWRSTDRYAPHNTYTSNTLWEKAWSDYGKEKKSDAYASWTYNDTELACTDQCANEITATFLAPTYRAVWKYNTSTHQYERFQDGKPHVDQNGKPIVADTVIAQHVTTNVLDAVGRIEMDTMKGGKAVVFRDGRAIDAEWKKEGIKARTRWIDAEGNDVPLKSGKIWIEVINQRGDIQYK